MIARLLSFALILWALGFAVFAIALPRPAGDENTDGIVVLTGGANRIERGLAELAAHHAKRMLVSGVDRTVKPRELAAQTGASPALFACCIDLGHEAIDTRSNAEETANWLRKHHYLSVRLVTTDWHMPRARFELGHALTNDAGPAVAIVTDAVRSDPGFGTLINEYDKFLLRRLAAIVGV